MTTQRNKLGGWLLGGGLLLLLTAFLLCITYRSARQEQLNHALIAAVKHRDVQTVLALLDNGADPNAQDTRQPVPSWSEYLLALFHRHSSPLHNNSQGSAPALCLTVSSFDTDIARLLINKGANVNALDRRAEYRSNGLTPLVAAMQKVFDRYNMGGDYDPDPPYQPYIKLLVDNGANLNAKNEVGMTPLYIASLMEDEDTVRLLLGKGADVNARTEDGTTALAAARLEKHRAIVRLLEQARAK
jgi:ankyrin repeat protein